MTKQRTPKDREDTNQEEKWFTERRRAYLELEESEKRRRAFDALHKAGLATKPKPEHTGNYQKIKDLHSLQGLPRKGDLLWIYPNPNNHNYPKDIKNDAWFQIPWRIVSHSDLYFRIKAEHPIGAPIYRVHKDQGRSLSRFRWQKFAGEEHRP